MDLGRGRLAGKYLFIELLPGFIMGVVVFLFILLVFQALRLTEFILAHGVALTTVAKLTFYLSISFLPIILPMSLLFAVLLGYGRLSSDSEILAFRALGLSMVHITIPAAVLGILVTIASAYTSFSLAPWGNRQFELLIAETGRLKASVTLREGVFSEGFFDMVVYASQVDETAGVLHKVFIYDEREPSSPMTIIAQRGSILHETDPKVGERARLRLEKGSIHRQVGATYTKIDFGDYDLNLFNPVEIQEKNKSLPSLTLSELEASLDSPMELKQRLKHQVEYHRRMALPFACLIFAAIGVGLGTSANRRAHRAGGMALCLLVIIAYWLLYVTAEGLARNQVLAPSLALWSVNLIAAVFAAWSLRRAAQ